ncbi:glutamate synthase [Amycolatopsis antarctica]|uniref:Glutamate synthase n=1 Tax=Amycolatopsis antarctica TaxID=1854586 RepID=A0A263D479_9PSEU|nr:glutamate synthase-related protein [Amycolatopsis antarctica]OZM73292.1 glutamate synthase [Amycolatopsis antarctica]
MSISFEAPGFPADEVRARARHGRAAVFPDAGSYGTTLFGATPAGAEADPLEAMRLLPPIFMPHRMEKLIELGREPTYHDVSLNTAIGGFVAPMPLYVSAFGSTRIAGRDLGIAVSAQAGRLGLPMVIGENVVPVHGYGRAGSAQSSMLERIRTYVDALPAGLGGIVVQQSTEDADAEVWNLIYSDSATRSLLESGRLAFELKVGQGAKPGLGGMTLLDGAEASELRDRYTLDTPAGDGGDRWLRHSSPGTFTAEVLRQQIRLMRNNYPKARTWVKLPPGRDIHPAVRTAVSAGVDAVTVDGAEGGTGWAPKAFLTHVGLPLAECLRRIGPPLARSTCLLVSGRFWEGARVAKSLALGAGAAGLGRAALVAAATDFEHGLERLADSIGLELRMILSALGKYELGLLGHEDLLDPRDLRPAAHTETDPVEELR